MYIILFSVVLIIGLLLLFLPFGIIENCTKYKWFSIIIRLIGIVLCIASAVSIYAVLSGEIVLPLIK